jgi:hypothetical protein
MRARLVLVAFLALACGEAKSSAPAKPSEEPGLYIDVSPPFPELFVVVADDRADAADLRATVARTFEQWDALNAQATSSCQLPYDPAAFHPVDRSLLVVHPSADPGERYTTSADLPSLTWRTDQRTDAQNTTWSDAVTAALEPKSPDAGAFAALDSIQRTVAVLDGTSEPASDEESRLAAFAPYEFKDVFMAVGHEDESNGDPASFAVGWTDFTLPGAVILPAATTPRAPGGCWDSSVNDTPRYAAWRSGQTMDVGHWPCSDETFFPPYVADCFGGNCINFTPVIDPDGSARCTVTAMVENDGPCDPAFGWLDPVGPSGTRAPKVVKEEGVERRVCEIQQLTGAALASCVTSLECEDCEPGWCATQVPDLLDCSEGTPNPFRFVGGSDSAAFGTARISCEKPR